MALVILTKPEKLNLSEKTKDLVKIALRRQRGPRMVTSSLIKGLKELGEDF